MSCLFHGDKCWLTRADTKNQRASQDECGITGWRAQGSPGIILDILNDYLHFKSVHLHPKEALEKAQKYRGAVAQRSIQSLFHKWYPGADKKQWGQGDPLYWRLYIPTNDYGISEGYYSINQIADLLKKHKDWSGAVEFIADMMEI